jgi:hypothetical protein
MVLCPGYCVFVRDYVAFHMDRHLLVSGTCLRASNGVKEIRAGHNRTTGHLNDHFMKLKGILSLTIDFDIFRVHDQVFNS